MAMVAGMGELIQRRVAAVGWRGVVRDALYLAAACIVVYVWHLAVITGPGR